MALLGLEPTSSDSQRPPFVSGLDCEQIQVFQAIPSVLTHMQIPSPAPFVFSTLNVLGTDRLVWPCIIAPCLCDLGSLTLPLSACFLLIMGITVTSTS